MTIQYPGQQADLRGKLVYLAAPYSDPNKDIVRQRMAMFTQIDGIMHNAGIFTVSPLEKHHTLEQTKLPSDWGYWESFGRALLSKCDALAVIMMPGWKESVGVQGEIQIAKFIGLPIYYIPMMPNEILWIPLDYAKPQENELIYGRTENITVDPITTAARGLWTEQWDSDEPLGSMVQWAPFFHAMANPAVEAADQHPITYIRSEQ